MGMTDGQFKAFLMGLVSELEKGLKETPDSKVIKELIERYKEIIAGL